MLKKNLSVILISLFVLSWGFNTVLARIGVGVGVGKIQVDEDLRPGVIYNLPPVTVLNTGDEASDYELSIEYHEKQPQLRPKEEWFIFSPSDFYLEPGGAQQVDIKLNLPLKMEPGDYFAYVEAHPTKKAVNGQTRIGVAAATKLYFTVVPANFIQGIYYKIVSFWRVYSPWPQRVLFTLLASLALLLFKKFFNIQVNVKKTGRSVSEASEQDDQNK